MMIGVHQQLDGQSYNNVNNVKNLTDNIIYKQKVPNKYIEWWNCTNCHITT